MKNFIIGLIILLLIAVGVYFFFIRSSETVEVDNEQNETDITEVETDLENADEPMAAEDETEELEGQTTLGTSAIGNDIIAYHYGTGDDEILFVGGIHGGYSWNTVLVAREIMDHLEANPEVIPDNVRVTVVPLLNPDGLEAVVGTTGTFSQSDVPSAETATIPGRFNGNEVDLNRNFDCDWQSTGTWQSRSVDGGSAPFSEPESQAMRDYIETNDPRAVVVYYSAAGGVFASNCHNGVLAETTEITNVYADASGYPAYEEFNFYEITGDMVNWLASINIPGISVLLSTHQDVEWNMNRAGIEALLEHYSE